ncbi:LysR family transcriptional regulator [Labrys okinawensis]|uniref:LysR family transcriptional regulator n=1 Tax=Labrys okinawensis TaxID=346911 RepID=UPI0039BC40E0
MDTSTLAIALTVLQEGSIRGAGRLLGRGPASVADAFERFERELAMPLALRTGGTFALTLAGETLARSSAGLLDSLAALAVLGGASVQEVRHWAAHRAIPIAALAHFNAVVGSGSIRSAAQTLGLGQPHVSRQMARLEALLDRRLLQRTGTGCEPTAEGLRLNEIAVSLIEEVAGLTAPAQRRFARTTRTVRLGTIIPIGHESRLAARLARLVAEWRRDSIAHDLLVSATTAEELMAGLRAGRFDIALMDTPMRQRRFESRELFSSELVLAGPKATLASGVSLEALLETHLIAVPSLRSGLRQRIRDVLDPLLARTAPAGRQQVEVDALSIIVNLMLEHGYLTVMPRDAIASLDKEIGLLPLPNTPRLGFHLAWPKTDRARQVAAAIAAGLA